jgi:hypothetical protein
VKSSDGKFNFKVTDLDHRRVLLSWEEWGLPRGLYGRIQVGENGPIPEADQWKKVDMKFEVPLEKEWKRGFAAVLVPDSFE